MRRISINTKNKVLNLYRHGIPPKYLSEEFKVKLKTIYDWMRLLHAETPMNHKKIQRLMRKYGLFCPVRKPNPYKQMMKASQEARTAPNLVQRQFKAFGPRMVLLTDITYMFYRRGERCYLSVIKDYEYCKTGIYPLNPGFDPENKYKGRSCAE